LIQWIHWLEAENLYKHRELECGRGWNNQIGGLFLETARTRHHHLTLTWLSGQIVRSVMAIPSAEAGVRGNVQDYYGKRVKTSEDLMTGCCTMDPEAFSKAAKEARKLIHPEVLSKYSAVHTSAVKS
jgi:hypothetical protein